MKAGTPIARRSKALSAQLGLMERLFAGPEERRAAAEVERGLEAVEAGLLEQVGFADSIADVTTRYLLAAGGKRVRPMLTLLTAQLGEGVTPAVITAAQAVEITHLASLYHDDVMDEAETRRGVPSAQTVWGNSVAILTGDLLFARASKLISSLGDAAAVAQSETFERLVLGQLHETTSPSADDDPVEHYLDVLADKTGSLIAAAAQFGLVFSHAPDEYLEPVVQYGERIGIAFQLADDVIDLSAKPEETGKQPGTDLLAGVPTMPLLLLRRSAAHDAGDAALLARIEADLDDAGRADDAAALADAVRELRNHHVTRDTLADAHRWARDAVDALAPLPNGSVKRALTRFADAVVDRRN